MTGIPNVGIVVDEEHSSQGTLVQDTNGDGTLDDADTVVGQITISGPSAESSGAILQLDEWPLTVSGDGVEGPSGSFISVPIEVGAEAGIYEVTVLLSGGGESTIFVVVEE